MTVREELAAALIAGIVVGAVAWIAARNAAQIGRTLGTAAGTAAVQAVDGAVSGVVYGVGGILGLPDTRREDVQSRGRDELAAGDYWHASQDLPAGEFITGVWKTIFH